MTSEEMQRVLRPFNFCFQSGELAVREALSKVLAGLSPLDLDIEEAGAVELVLAEALNNIVEHAYPEGLKSGPIEIACVYRSDGLHLCIRDEGNAMPDGRLPLGEAQSVDVDLLDMPEGGFGWFIIRDLAKDVSYRRVGLNNQLNLRLAVAIGTAA